MPKRNRWKLGDSLCVCDRTGLVRYRSEMRREWNGLLVWKRALLQRNPQDLKRSLRDDARVEDARPRGIDQFTGPLSTEIDGDHSAGTQTIAVLSSERFEPGDHLRIGLDNKEMFRTIVQTVPDGASIELTQKLPWAASSGNTVINISAVSQSDLA
jgi:hypothetical protein